MAKKNLFLLLTCLCLLLAENHLQALVGSWPLQMVTVGDPGNAPNTNSMSFLFSDSSVSSSYQIGKYTITAGQYCDFLNAVGNSDPYGCYDTNMGATNIVTNITITTLANVSTTNTNITYYAQYASIKRSGSRGYYTYSLLGSSYSNLPIVYLDWFKAARFCNWMYNYCTNEPEGYDSTEMGSYFLNGATNGKLIPPLTNATWLIPNDNQWRKAAYYKGGSTNAGYWLYPTKSNLPPGNTIDDASTTNTDANWRNFSTNYATAGTAYSNSYLTPVGLFANSPGPYGTYDMAGNVQELINNSWKYYGYTEVLGGSFYSRTLDEMNQNYVSMEPFPNNQIGFRICAPTSTISSNYIPQ